jgi:arylsulfatase A-like enzyme
MRKVRGLSRREFLKLISMVPVGIYSRPLSKLATLANGSGQKNIILLVFDAWSQHNVSLYGYRRHTMPNLEQFAKNATVYHNHYSTGTFTVPGTSSLLTGMYPWSHRAFQLGGTILQSHAKHSIFSALSSTHSTLAYTQNKFADQILNQLDGDLDNHVNYWSFNTQISNPYSAAIFRKNPRMGFASFEDNLVQKGDGFDSSLFFGPLYRLFTLYNRQMYTSQYKKEYPRGLPDTTELFFFQDLIDGAINMLKEIQQPSLTYFHFYPPHEPYNPSKEFFGKFTDGWILPEKPLHDLSDKKIKSEKLREHHQYYDEFIANWDAEAARLFQYLEESGLTENSYIIITSDHGDMFERGELGHWTPTIYDPVIHVPLIVRQPGQKARKDVHTMTSSIDLLPTITHLTGNPIPEWAEGTALPELGGTPDEKRSFFAMDAKSNSSFGPLVNYSMSLTRDGHRLVYYCYPKDNYHTFELYDIDADREEMENLYPKRPSLAAEMEDELLQKVHDVNKPFRRDNS